MKICLAQIQSFKGDIRRNIERHKESIHAAIAQGADTIIFPELSLTGYEPSLAKALATSLDDPLFDEFQRISNTHQISILMGMPLHQHTDNIYIGMPIFQPNQARLSYLKHYLHSDEKPFFSSGKNTFSHIGKNPKIALAICYELSVAEHAEHSCTKGANLYLASVAKTASGVEQASLRLAGIAKQYSIPCMMVNGVGPADNFVNTGGSAVWNEEGEVVARLGEKEEGMLIVDMEALDKISVMAV